MSEKTYDNEKRFVFFPNTKKEAGSQQPDYTGELTLDGKKYRLSGWRNVSKSGTTYVAGRVGDFDYQGGDGAPSESVSVVASPMPPADDIIPF